MHDTDPVKESVFTPVRLTEKTFIKQEMKRLRRQAAALKRMQGKRLALLKLRHEVEEVAVSGAARRLAPRVYALNPSRHTHKTRITR